MFVDAVRLMGFTERQAGFLVTVMLYAGVCFGRHYCTFARIAYGQKMHDFLSCKSASTFSEYWRNRDSRLCRPCR